MEWRRASSTVAVDKVDGVEVDAIMPEMTATERDTVLKFDN